MMTILDLLKAGKIRWSNGIEFGSEKSCGRYHAIETEAEIPEAVAREGASYGGSIYVTFDDAFPAHLIPDDPEHCWAIQLCCGTPRRPIGAIVTWSSESIEQAHRAAVRSATEISFEEFNVRRHGAPVVEG